MGRYNIFAGRGKAHDHIREIKNMFTANEIDIINQARNILESKSRTDAAVFTSAENVKNFLMCSLVPSEREVFTVLLLDTQHRLIESVDLFKGTIDSAAVYPREVVKLALQSNAAAIILSHNHPSGIPEPSAADVKITDKIKAALSLVDIRLLDHIVVGFDGTVSMTERGLI
jgi:DNA repair protein RadC